MTIDLQPKHYKIELVPADPDSKDISYRVNEELTKCIRVSCLEHRNQFIALLKEAGYKEQVPGTIIKPVLQAIVIAGEAMRDDTLSNKKQITIREGLRDYRIGKVMLGCHKLNWACKRMITSVRHTALGEVTYQEMKDDGFNSYDELVLCLRQWYPDITENSPVTIVRWK